MQGCVAAGRVGVEVIGARADVVGHATIISRGSWVVKEEREVVCVCRGGVSKLWRRRKVVPADVQCLVVSELIMCVRYEPPREI
jgi:hypothetical protein